MTILANIALEGEHICQVFQILREINFRNSRSSKTAIFAIFDALNFDFDEFLLFFMAANYPKIKFRVPKIVKWQFLGLQNDQN